MTIKTCLQAQYIFLHQTLLEALLLNDVTLPSSDDFKDKYTKLCLEDPATGKSKIQCQFEVRALILIDKFRT